MISLEILGPRFRSKLIESLMELRMPRKSGPISEDLAQNDQLLSLIKEAVYI